MLLKWLVYFRSCRQQIFNILTYLDRANESGGRVDVKISLYLRSIYIILLAMKTYDRSFCTQFHYQEVSLLAPSMINNVILKVVLLNWFLVFRLRVYLSRD